MSTEWVRAYAIGSAGIDDASTVFFNPAGMSRLSGTHLNGGLQVVYSQVDFKGSGEYNPNNPALTAPTAAGGFGMDPANPGRSMANRRLTLTCWPASPAAISPTSTATGSGSAFGVNAPFGLETDYDNDWVGRYHAIKSELLTVNFNPSMAFKFTEHATIGFGLSALYADGELTQAVDGALLGAFWCSSV